MKTKDGINDEQAVYLRTLALLLVYLDGNPEKGLDVENVDAAEAMEMCKGFSRDEVARMARVLSMILSK